MRARSLSWNCRVLLSSRIQVPIPLARSTSGLTSSGDCGVCYTIDGHATSLFESWFVQALLPPHHPLRPTTGGGIEHSEVCGRYVHDFLDVTDGSANKRANLLDGQGPACACCSQAPYVRCCSLSITLSRNKTSIYGHSFTPVQPESWFLVWHATCH